MSVTGYYGMADGKVFADPVLNEIAASRGKSVAQVVLRWLVQQQGVVALSKTVSEARVDENLAIFDFELSADEMATIHALAKQDGRIVSPDGLAPEWDEVA
ncbi:Glyoxal reductase [compost metagenome]